MSPYDILVNNYKLFELVVVHKYLPQGSNELVQQVWNAYKQINPQAKCDFGCQSCVIDMLKQANFTRLRYLESKKKV